MKLAQNDKWVGDYLGSKSGQGGLDSCRKVLESLEKQYKMDL